MKELVDPVSPMKYPEYFRLFNGEKASEVQIRQEHPALMITVKSMLEMGYVVGQRTFLTEDCQMQEDTLYIMPTRGGSFNAGE